MGLPLAAAVMAAVLSLHAQALAPAGAGQQVHANLNQLMRGTLYPAANVVFSAQTDDPGEARPLPGQDPSMATDPLHSTFGGWVAVENAALALAESANLLSIAGRTCANGVDVPIADPAWAAFVRQLREASMQAYRAAQSRDQARMIDISEPLSAACAGCHRKWRDRRPLDRRCR
ncbi:MAG TPA: hypothetical protein VG871_20490 [Vicinamibacterales bacterium]|nr:hypothetical protein [Vicinamibacterales bacterium]